MSFVSVVATEKFIAVMSDGLIKDIETDKDLGKRYQKFTKICNNQFVAFAGNHGVAEALRKAIPFIKRPRDLLQTSEVIHKRLLEEIPSDKAKMSVVIGGVNLEGNIEYHYFTNDIGSDINSNYPKEDGLLCAFLQGPETSHIDLEPVLIDILRQTGINTPNKILKAQKRLNDYVEERDSTVNKVTFELSIRKP